MTNPSCFNASFPRWSLMIPLVCGLLCGDASALEESIPIWKADNTPYQCVREPVVVRTKSGRIIVGVHAGNRLGWPERSGQDLAIRVSDDLGSSWSDIIIAAEHGDFSCQCHGLVYDQQINRVLFLYTVYNWDYQAVGKGRGTNATKPIYEQMATDGLPFVSSYRVFSDDEGKTWSQPEEITSMVGTQAHFGASEGRQVTTGPHRGRLLLAGSRMDLNPSGNIIAKHPGVWKSDDHGQSWRLVTIPMDPKIATPRNASSEARVTELANGTLLYNQRTRNTGRHLSWSTDGGDSWKKTIPAADLKVSQCNGCILTLRGADGQLTDTVFFSIPSPGGRSDGLVYVSQDGGRTWPIRHDVVTGPFAYSAVIQLDADHIGLLYEASHYKEIRWKRLAVSDLLKKD